MTFAVTYDFANGTVADADEVNENFEDIEDEFNGITATALVLSPIGSVTAWLKSFPNTPALPTGWVECNGQVLSDSGSVYNGQTIPNLNASGGGTKRFLRGSTTSGTTGGADTHTLSVGEMPGHTHVERTVGGGGPSGPAGSGGNANSSSTSTDSTGGGQAHNNLPSYYEIVWILRVK